MAENRRLQGVIRGAAARGRPHAVGGGGGESVESVKHGGPQMGLQLGELRASMSTLRKVKKEEEEEKEEKEEEEEKKKEQDRSSPPSSSPLPSYRPAISPSPPSSSALLRIHQQYPSNRSHHT